MSGVELVIKVGRDEWRIVAGRSDGEIVKDGSWRRSGRMARGWFDVGVRMRLVGVSNM